jgi:uncharacterized membrane protein (UPF0127 family)
MRSVLPPSTSLAGRSPPHPPWRGAALVIVLVALALSAPVLAQAPARDWIAGGLAADQVPAADSSDSCQGGAPYADVLIDSQPRLSLELARTPASREVGLMFRPSLDPDSGMLFVYDRPATEGYWMHNTLIPLSIAWLDRNGSIVDVQDMQALTDDTHTPVAPYWYALETNLGWFQAHGVGIGQVVQLCLGQ